MQMIPLIFYPLTIICIDDNPEILEILKKNLGNNFRLITYESAYLALKEIKSTNKFLNKYLNNIFSKENKDNLDLQLNIKIAQISKITMLEERYKEICIVISDYRMSELDGIELFKNISGLGFKKILLTEHQDYQKVMNAFNARTIDLFLLKSTENIVAELTENIKNLMTEFFIENTKFIKSIIETDCLLPNSDPEFIIFFEKIVKKLEIVEYSLYDTNGSLLLRNIKHEKFYLIVHTDRSLENFTELYNDPACMIFIEKVINREKIPFFKDIDPTDIELTEWGKYFYVPETLIGREKYYLHILKEEI